MSSVNNGNGDTAINIENIEMENLSGQSFRELKVLLSKTKAEYNDTSTHFQNILNLLERGGKKLCELDRNGENIFHCIALHPERDPNILTLFGLCNDEKTEGLYKYLSQHKIIELLNMPWGAKKSCPIHLAITNGFVPFVVEMLKICPIYYSNLLLAQDVDLNTPLHIAAQSTMPKSLEIMELLFKVMEENQLIEQVLMYKRNAEEKTPIHLLCTKVPKNKDAKVTAKLLLMLDHKCSNDILKSVDNSGKNPLHLLCSWNQQYKDSEIDRMKNACDLLRVLVKNIEIVNQPTSDKCKQTPLHLLALSESPKLMRILVGQTATDVMIKDANGLMAIHYVAIRALGTKSQQCVKILADWDVMQNNMASSSRKNDLFRDYLLWETYKHGDGNSNSVKTEWTAFTAACKSKSTKTVEFILRNVYKAKPDFGVWFMSKDTDKEDVFSLKQVFKNTPAALEFLFDESIHLDMENSNETRVEFVTNISVVTALRRPIQEETAISEMKYLDYASNWPEAIQEKILLHPLTQCTLDAMWETMLCYKILWFIFNVIWLAAYWTLVPLDYSTTEGKYEQQDVIAAWMLGALIILHLIDEVLSARTCLNRLAGPEISTKMIWIQTILTLVSIYGPCLGSVGLITTSPPSYIEKYCASGGVLISSILFWRNIAIIYLPLGIYVEYLIQTLKKILLAIICIVVVIIGFQKSFCQILPEEFPSVMWAFAKTLVMMTGEFDFEDLYKKDGEENLTNGTTSAGGQGSGGNGGSDWSGSINLLIFILFLIILPITFYNMITGVVVEKIVNMEHKLEMYRTRNQVRLINYLQRSIVSKLDCIGPFFQCLQPCFLSYRKTETGEVILRNEVRWYIDKDVEPNFWSYLRHNFGKLCSFGGKADGNNSSCGNFLSKRVRNHFFQKYEREAAAIQLSDHDDDIYA